VGSPAIYTPLGEVAVDGGKVLARMDNGYSDSSPCRAEEARNFVRGVGDERRTDRRQESISSAPDVTVHQLHQEYSGRWIKN
jgi:hypothetical protein